MAVLCEAISVVIRADRLLATFGTFEAFKELVPNRTLAADSELVRVGFMAPDDVHGFVKKLEARGLIYTRDGHAVDLVVVDQLRGPMIPCDWLEFGQVTIEGQKVAAARLKGSTSREIVTPEGWKPEDSLSQTFGFVPTRAESSAMRLLRHEDGMDVYFCNLTGKEVYVARTRGTRE